MKLKTSELTGAALDWSVAKCEGKNGVLHDDGITRCIMKPLFECLTIAAVIAAPLILYFWRMTP